MPNMPIGQRDDLNDPRLLAAARMVGAVPLSQDGEPMAAPSPRNDLTDPRLLAAARAAGIAIPEQPVTPERKNEQAAEVADSVVLQEISPSIGLSIQVSPSPVVADEERDTQAAATPDPDLAPAEALAGPVSVREPAKAEPAIAAKPEVFEKPKGLSSPSVQVTTPKPTPPAKKEYPISAPDARMIPFYENQLARENLDPVIRAYYERKLEESKSAQTK